MRNQAIHDEFATDRDFEQPRFTNMMSWLGELFTTANLLTTPQQMSIVNARNQYDLNIDHHPNPAIAAAIRTPDAKAPAGSSYPRRRKRRLGCWGDVELIRYALVSVHRYRFAADQGNIAPAICRRSLQLCRRPVQTKCMSSASS